ncbi:MAG: heavy metal translocating P-type ATPase [Eubacteriales bacterium]|nr:heavy metal translocating P-type ATPase [Eubacteriales bacterium]
MMFFKEWDKEQREALYRIAAAVVLLAVAWLLPVSGLWKALFFLVPYLIAGGEVLWSACKNIAHGEIFDEEFLMSIATLGALAIGEYPEAAAVMIFFQIGELFEDIAVGRSRRSIAALMDIRPDSAVVLRNGKEETVSPDTVEIGETILIKPGEKIALDGTITEGVTTVNAAALTGESMPQDKKEGERVLSGTVNLSGVIKVKTDSKFGESTVSKVLDLVENAASKKAKAENFITRFARYYTPCVVVGAVLLALLPPLFFGQPWSVWINRALIFLMVSCPCALVVSVPLSFFGGIGGASKEGILIKGASYLEALSKADTLVFDKTGTLTEGSFTVTAIHPERISEDKLLDIAAAAESRSDHPIAESIVRAHGGHIDPTRIGETTELSGMGVKTVIDGATVYIGNDKLMDSIGVEWHACHLTGTVVHLADGKEYLGHIIIADVPKKDAEETIAQLRKLGVKKTVMLTGDTAAVGEAVARELGVSEVHAGLLPAQKVADVEKLLQTSRGLVFVGDGINDAPVISRADVGVAMGALGSDAAIEAADVVLMDDKLSKLVRAIAIARKTMRIVKENIVFALAVKALVLLLGALGAANMWTAVFADVGVLILAILNALRALRAKR